MQQPYTVEVTKRNGKYRLYTSVYGQPRDTFIYGTEKAAVRKLQELNRAGYELVGSLPCA